MRLKLKLRPGQRLQAMVDAGELIMAAKLSHLRIQYPELSFMELNLKMLEEIERAKELSYPPGLLRRSSIQVR